MGMDRLMILRDPLGNAPTLPAMAGFVPRRTEDALAGQLLRPQFSNDRETLLLVGFDGWERLVKVERVESDEQDRCFVPPSCWRNLAGETIAVVLLAHNHPSGTAAPSDADLRNTQQAALLLRAMGIDLLDHLIFVDTGHFSFCRAGLL